MSNDFQSLITRLDEFIRKYYKNKLIRGTLLFSSFLLLAYLLCIFTDFFAQLKPQGRTVLFFSFVSLCLAAIGYFIAYPALKIFRLGKVISHDQAAQIIGQHFPDVNDKIINTLQLSQSAMLTSGQSELIHASIRQKIADLRPVPFVNAIDLSQNRKYAKYLWPPLLILLLLLLIKPEIVTESTTRLVNYDNEFKPLAPFRFNVMNKELVTAEKTDFRLQLQMTGKVLPEEVFIHIGDITYKMTKNSKSEYEYVFKNIQRNTEFYFSANGFESYAMEVKVLPRPTLLDFSIQLEYPKYLGKVNQTLSKTGDLTVPEGTKITWNISTKNTEKLNFMIGDSSRTLTPAGDLFRFHLKANHSVQYAFMAKNSTVKQMDSLGYFLNVIPDEYPTIQVEESIDSNAIRNRFFVGQINDDYGFTGLKFFYRQINDSIRKNNLEPAFKSMPVQIARNGNALRFTHAWTMNEMFLAPGDQVEYYFMVWDNDGVNGAKAARSQMKVFKVPTLEEISEQTDKNNSEIKKEMEAAIKDADKLRKELDNFQRDLVEKKNFDWQQKSKAEDLMKRQADLQLKLEQIQKMNSQNNEQKSEFKDMDPDLLEKQKMLDELMEKLMTDDMKKMLEELQKLMEQMDKNAIQQQVEKMELTDKDLKKELDRSLELFKQMELEQKVEDVTEKLDELAQEQKDLAEESKQKDANTNEIEKKQEELNKKFEELKKELNEIDKLNQELEEPMELSDTKQDQDNISKEMQESKDNLSKDKNKKASENQQKAGDQMQDLSKKLQKSLESAQEKQNEIDMQALRQLLENVIQLSFDQEELMNQLGATATKDPKYVKLGQQQRKLKDDAKMVEDSLFALSKRVVQLKTYVNQEISKVNENMALSMKKIEDRNTALANKHQQFVMTSLNNLALLLDEALQSMQQQQQQAYQGKPSNSKKRGKCNKPGNANGDKPGDKPSFGKGGKPSIKGMKQMQEQLAKQMEQLKKQMEQGKTPGKDGKGSGGLMPGMSEELAKAAAKQQALRQMLQQLGQELNKDGSGNGKELQKIAEEMEKNEEDLVNKNITIETLKRQQDILTRLLESEKAERERDQDNKRESTENKFEDFSNQKQFLEYKRKKEKEVELLKTVPPALTPYYKQKVNNYFNQVQ